LKQETSHKLEISQSASLLTDIGLLIKFRLTLTVVFTSILGYIITAKNYGFNTSIFVLLSMGGFLVTSAANIINEVLEKDYDALMKRTSIRPLVTGKIKSSTAVLLGGLSCLVGVLLLSMINPTTAMLGMLSFVLYAFVYTPLKRMSTLSVAIGAIPGALPVLIGSTAFDGEITVLGVSLFLIQFIWQFPHFWSIGFLSYDDYKNAGYKLMPADENGNVDNSVGFYSFLYSILLLPVLGYLYFLKDISILSFALSLLLSFIFIGFSFNFYKKLDRKSGLALMFSSFFYMPLILLILLFGK
jgi:protoheme IX farnesyltransferase